MTASCLSGWSAERHPAAASRARWRPGWLGHAYHGVRNLGRSSFELWEGVQVSFEVDGSDEQLSSWSCDSGHGSWASVFALLPRTQTKRDDTILLSTKVDVRSNVPQYELCSAVGRGGVPNRACGSECKHDLGDWEHIVMPWLRTCIP